MRRKGMTVGDDDNPCDRAHEDLATAGRFDLRTTGVGRPRSSGTPTLAELSTDRYTVLEELGRGGMGIVVRAHDRTLQREVALKVLRADAMSPAMQARFAREAQSMAQLNHPNVVAVYDVEQVGERTMIVMEYVRGCTVSDWLQSSARAWRDVVEVYLHAGRGLAAAHAVGLLHRDFKPNNVLVGADASAKVVKVVDFGLARPEANSSWPDRADSTHEPCKPSDGVSSLLTTIGTVMGTPAYMAPEQHLGGELLTPATDQYAFCVSLWQGLTGQLPFGGIDGDVDRLLHRKRRGPPPWLERADVPATLVAAIERGLAVDPARRHVDLQALLEELERLVGGRSRRFRWWWATGLVGAGLLAGVGWNDRPPACSGAERHIEEVWNPSVSQGIASAVQARGGSVRTQAWEIAAPQFEVYAAAWTASYRDTCRAMVAGEQPPAAADLRLACLFQAKQSLAAAVAVLQYGEGRILDHAPRLAEGLPSLAACEDVEALALRAPVVLDPQDAAMVDELRRILTLHAALIEVGRPTDALHLLESSAARTDGLHDRGLRAELALARGQALVAVGRYADSVESLSAAYFDAVDRGRSELAAEAATELATVLGPRLHRHGDAQVWLEHAGSQLERLEPPATDLEIELLLARSNVQLGMGAFEDAERTAEQALMALERAGDADPKVRLVALMVLTNAQRSAVHLDAAMRTGLSAVDLAERQLGPLHPELATALELVGIVHEQRRELDEARRLHQRALEIRSTALGSDHPDVGLAHAHLAQLFDDAGDLEAAMRSWQRAAAILERRLGPDHPSTAAMHHNLGCTLYALRRLDEADAALHRGLAVFEATFGEDHPHVALALYKLAGVALDRGRAEEAEALAQRALAIQNRVLAPEHPDRGLTVLLLGNIAAKRGDLDAAELRYDEALHRFERAYGPDSPTLVHVLLARGELLLRRERAAAADADARRAVALVEANVVTPRERAGARFLLAQTHDARTKDRAAALRISERALQELADAGPSLDDQRALIVGWQTTVDPRRPESGHRRLRKR